MLSKIASSDLSGKSRHAGKNLVMLSFITFLFFGCKEKDVIEVIPNYDEIYLPISKVDSTPKLIEGNEKELSDKINE